MNSRYPFPMKCVFLDFDGVLNSWSTFAEAKERRKDTPLPPGGAREVADREEIDPYAVRRLNTILWATGAMVVVSSTWRKAFTLEEIRRMLCYNGFQFPDSIIGVTPELGVQRGFEIQAWLDKHPEVTEFVILDDDGDMAHLKSYLVRTSMATGMLDEHVESAVKMLGGSL